MECNSLNTGSSLYRYTGSRHQQDHQHCHCVGSHVLLMSRLDDFLVHKYKQQNLQSDDHYRFLERIKKRTTFSWLAETAELDRTGSGSREYPEAQYWQISFEKSVLSPT
uniref:Uncharacterized protein n=1 Tax=Cacopsylla melanoneura TaxID=428564 RepID=A0A8D8Z8C9_9HEMI